MPRQCDIQVVRMRVVMNTVQRARGVVSLCTLLAVAVVLWQGTATTRAQGPPPSPDEDVSAAHLSPDGCSELIINGGFEATDLQLGAWRARPCRRATPRRERMRASAPCGWASWTAPTWRPATTSTRTLRCPTRRSISRSAFTYWASHEDTPGSDMQLLNIYETTTGVRLAQPWSRLSNEQTWQFEQIDLTHFRGRTLRIEFGVHNDGGGGRTALYLDEVSLLPVNRTRRRS